MKIIKANTYNIVSNEPFEIPLPIKFELWNDNTLLVEYSISEDAKVDFSYNPDANEKILTSTSRPLVMPDIYFLFSSRVFQKNQYYTQFELKRFGLKEYNPYDIVRKTHGIQPQDQYWLRFEGETFSHSDAVADVMSYYAAPRPAERIESEEAANAKVNSVAAEMMEQDTSKIEEILDQKSVHFDNLAEKIAEEEHLHAEPATVVKNTEETGFTPFVEPELTNESDGGDSLVGGSSGDKLSDDQIAALFARLNG